MTEEVLECDMQKDNGEGDRVDDYQDGKGIQENMVVSDRKSSGEKTIVEDSDSAGEVVGTSKEAEGNIGGDSIVSSPNGANNANINVGEFSTTTNQKLSYAQKLVENNIELGNEFFCAYCG